MRQSSCHYQIAALVVFCIFTGSYMIKNTSIDAMATDSSLISLRNLLSSFTLSLFLSLCLTHTRCRIAKIIRKHLRCKICCFGERSTWYGKNTCVCVCICGHTFTLFIHFIYVSMVNWDQQRIPLTWERVLFENIHLKCFDSIVLYNICIIKPLIHKAVYIRSISQITQVHLRLYPAAI